MEIAKQMAGFSPAEADDLRKAVGKKKRDLMATMEDKFLAGLPGATDVYLAPGHVTLAVIPDISRFPSAEKAEPKAAAALLRRSECGRQGPGAVRRTDRPPGCRASCP